MQIDNAIQVHTDWFLRLRRAIESGQSEFDPDIVKTDYNCVFGKWLYREVPQEYRSTAIYFEIKDLHARFHTAAGHVLLLALTGKKEQALQDLEAGTEIRKISLALIMKCNECKEQWK